ncbi:uncharacterized protein PGTG_07563 [Puccinia graminis f. sp. tritici CRL 75-36-700-3]|uniref:Uncharacterized protein n=1 Tax=Puccinia graminis f. sp. tritici (strain CRL 75-36-700-3 / race SCCL) TaxID=418459 RepID=E3KCL4_PUCGT|nr:uncharacterized protein PGTG_07563 [Puccinia graminis f. sp. tritici CRL 75-36-700-3]EFP82166.2 hypothetical protein PGTG_07563 [Puccinia graminis f. sp. tritici CRL 75-36-700-3]
MHFDLAVYSRCFLLDLMLCWVARILATGPLSFDLNYPPITEGNIVEEQVAARDNSLSGSTSPFLAPSRTQQDLIGAGKRKLVKEEPLTPTVLQPNNQLHATLGLIPQAVSNHDAPETKPSFTAYNDVNMEGSEFKLSGNTDHGNNVGSLGRSDLIQPVDNIEGLAVTEPRSKKARLDLVRPKASYLDDFQYLKSAKSTVAVVRECQLDFETRLVSPELLCFSHAKMGHVHSNLPFAMINRWKLLFKKLITYTYQLHQTLLSKSGMTVSAQRVQHAKLLKWLLNQIFEPRDPLIPVIGVIQKPYPDWQGDQPYERLGKTQIQLINYFSGDGEHEVTANLAVYLLETYQGQHEESFEPKSEVDQALLKKLLEWLCEMILDPKSTKSLPIMGLTKANGIIAPWEEAENEGVQLFGPVQIQLIHHFSGGWKTNESLKSTAAFALTSFYQDHCPRLFNHLMLISHH